MLTKTTSSIPLWLDIKTEYIDQSFDKAVEYLKNSNKTDSFYQFTLNLMVKRGLELLETLKNRPLYYGESVNSERGELIFDTRVLAAALLSNAETDTVTKKRLIMPMLNTLSMLVPADLCGDLLALMVDNIITAAEPRLCFSWDDIIHFEPEVMAHKILNGTVFDDTTPADVSYENKGFLTVWDDKLGIAALSENSLRLKGSLITTSMDILDGKISLLTQRSDRLKQSDQDNLVAIGKYTDEFIQDQTAVMPRSFKTKRLYNEGDTLRAKVISANFGEIVVRSTDPDYETVEGKIVFNEPNILFYYPYDFTKYLKVGDEIEVELVSFALRQFSLRSCFVRYIIEDIIRAHDHVGKVVLAKVINVATNRKGVKQIDWVTEDGYPVHSDYDPRFQKDDFGRVKITSLGSGPYYGYINAIVVEESYRFFDVSKVKQSVVENYVYDPSWSSEAKAMMLNSSVISDLIVMMIRYQKTLENPSERFKVLCISKILSQLIDSKEHLSYISFVMDYFRQLIHFTRGNYESIKEITPPKGMEDIDVVKRRCDIVKILRAYNHDENNDDLETLIKQSTDATLTKIAKLVQASNNIGDVIPAAMKNIIKREIMHSLSLETEDETNLDEENGLYLGMEDRHQEFKTSFVYPPDNGMLPSVSIQERNIFKVLCGFLNTQAGGTLFLGVNDLGYVVGIEDDLKYLKIDTMDAYIRFIQDEAHAYFDVSVLAHFLMRPMYDDKVLAIMVEPYEEEIVEFDQQPYIRVNNETLVMTDKMRNQLLSKRAMAKAK